ncbi:MAG: hypothetical protein ACPH7H_06625, partial [Porticoccaceae bacterium]
MCKIKTHKILPFFIISLLFVHSNGAFAITSTADFSAAFGDTVISEDGNTFTFPMDAQDWAGFANMNTDLYPLRFTEDGSITFTGSVADGGSADVRFRLEYNPHPDVDPAYDSDVVTVSGATPTEYMVAIPSQGANTFSSLIMYIVDRDIAVTVSEIVVATDAVDSDAGGDTDTVGDTGSDFDSGAVAVWTPFAGSGATMDGNVFTFPTGSQSWAGFANVNTSLYPFSFAEDG